MVDRAQTPCKLTYSAQVHVEMNDALLQMARPAVPLVYNLGEAAETSAAVPDRWQPAQHFQEDTLPGFTSGLKAELVMQTFRLPAKTVAKLESAGVTCTLLEGP